MPNLPIFDGTVPPGECGYGCVMPTISERQWTVKSLPLFDRPLMSDDEIDERSEALEDIVLGRANSTPWIYQGNQGSCTTAGAGHIIMDRNAEEGEPVELLSQASLYFADGLDANGDPIPRRADNGMALSTAIQLLRTLGMAPASLIDPMDYRGWRDWPDGWRQVADDNRLLEWQQVRGLREIKTALATPLPVLHGYAGHARMLVWWDPREQKFHAKNSWRTQPWHYLSERQASDGERQYEAFALVSTVARGELERITPPNAELLELADKYPPPPEYYQEDEDPAEDAQ